MSLQAVREESVLTTSSLLRQFNHALLNPLVVQARDWQDLPVRALTTSPAPARPHRLPQLIDLAMLSDEQHDALADRMGRYRQRGISFFSALMTGDVEADAMAYHLRRQLLQRRPDDRRYYWFRYYDPLVFRHLRWLLTPKQLTRLLGPIDIWSWPDVQGRWQQLERPGERPIIDWLELTRPQWASIDRFAVVNQSLRRLATVAPDWPQDDTHWRWLDDMLRYGQDHGLSIEDQQCLAEKAAQYHPALASHPAIQRLLAQPPQGASDVAGHLDRLSNAEWRTIIAELEESA